MSQPRTRTPKPAPRRKTTQVYCTTSRKRDRKRSYNYVLLRYDEYREDGSKQPRTLASLGREEQVDRDRAGTAASVLQEFVRKGSTMTEEELRERLGMIKPKLKILCSRQFGLRFLVEQAFAELGYLEVLREIAADRQHQFAIEQAVFGMVLQQIVDPGSKLRAAERLHEIVFFPEGEGLTVDHYYRALDVLATNQERVEAKLLEKLQAQGLVVDTLAHDTTSSFFRTDYDDVEWQEAAADRDRERAPTLNDPPLRMRGHSKDGKPNKPQIVVESVACEGYVIHHEVHPGNTADKALAPAAVDKLADRGLAQEAVWIGDTGMNSRRTQERCARREIDWVLGEGQARTAAVREVIAEEGPWQQHPDNPNLSYRAVQRGGLLYVVRCNQKEKLRKERQVSRHLTLVRKALAQDDRVQNHGKKVCGLLSHRSHAKYVRPRADDPTRLEVNEDRVAQERALAGRSVISTAMTDLDPLVADDLYRRLYEIEDAFRTLKDGLDLRPIRHRKAPRIRAHVLVVVMAYNIVKHLEKKTGLRLARLRDYLISLTVQQIEYGVGRHWQSPELSQKQHEIFEALGYDEPLGRFEVTLLSR